MSRLIRNTPFLVQVFLIFFGLPTIGIRLDANTGALIAMVLNGSAYTIEIVRAGIESIGHGQTEAAYALGLSRFRTFRLVVLPQALRVVVPPLGSQFILLMLNSSVVFGDLRGRTDGGDAGHPGPHLPPVRGVHRRYRHLFLPVDAVLRRLRR